MWRSIHFNSCTIRSIFMAILLLGILNECKGPKQRCSNKKSSLKFEMSFNFEKDDAFSNP